MDKENKGCERPQHRRDRSRRSSILKDSPSRNCTLEQECTMSNFTRRSSKRVSFADTKTIKEFVKMHCGNTEWNSSYETTAITDSSSSNSDSCQPHSLDESSIHPDERPHPTLTSTTLQVAVVSDEEDIKETTTFLQQYMSLSESINTPRPGTHEQVLSNSDDDDEGDTTNPANFLNNFLKLTSNPGSTQNMELTTAASQVPRLTQDLTQNMELTTAASQVPRLTQDLTMELTTAASQIPRLTQDLTQNMELTTAASQIPRLTQVLTQNMELTTAASQMPRLTQDLTQNMELTTAASQMPRLTQDQNIELTSATTQIPRLTQDLTQNMELTTAASQVPRLTQDLTMELTTAASQIPRLTQNLTQNMELTTAASQVPRLTQDLTMELTTAASQIPRLTQDLTQNMELTTAASQMPRLTQDLTQNMELTTAASQMPRLTQDLTQNMELTTAASQIPRLTQDKNIELTSATTQIPRLTQDLTQNMELTTAASHILRLTQNMELTTAASQIPRLTQDQNMELTTATTQISRLTQNMELTTAASQIPRLTQDLTMELTTAASHVPRLTQDQTQYMELTTAASQVPRLTQDLTQNMELTTAASQVPRLTQGLTQNMELTTAASQVPRLTQDLTQNMELTTAASQVPWLTQDQNMELTTAASQMPRLTQNQNMELTTAASQVSRLTQDLTQNMELTTAASQVSRLTQDQNMELTTAASQVPRLTQDQNMELTTAASQVSRLTQDLTQNMELTTAASQVSRLTQGVLTHHLTSNFVGISDSVSMTAGKEQLSRLSTQVEHNNVSIIQQCHDSQMFHRPTTLLQSQSLLNEGVVQYNSQGSPVTDDQVKLNDCITKSRKNTSDPDECTMKDIREERTSGKEPDSQVVHSYQLSCGLQEAQTSSSSHSSHQSTNSLVQTSDCKKRSPSPTEESEQSPKLFGNEVRCTYSQSSPNHSKSTTQHTTASSQKTNPPPTLLTSVGPSLIGEELLDDINISLVESMNDSAGELFTSNSPQVHHQHSSIKKDEKPPKRRSLAAEAIKNAMPLISSFLEQVKKADESQCVMEVDETEVYQTYMLTKPNTTSTVTINEQFLADDNTVANVETSSCTVTEAVLDTSTTADLVPDNSSSVSAVEGNNTFYNLPPHNHSHTTTVQMNNTTTTSTTVSNISTCCIVQEEPNESKHQQQIVPNNNNNNNNNDEDESVVMDLSSVSTPNIKTSNTKPRELLVYNLEDEQDNNKLYVSLEQQKCMGWCSLTQGSTFTVTSGEKWTLIEADTDKWKLQFNRSPLKLILTLAGYGHHAIITTAKHTLHPHTVKTPLGRLVLSVLGCRVSDALIGLSGIPVCEAGPTLTKVHTAYRDINTLMMELFELSCTYITEFTHNSIKVPVSSLKAHICVGIEVFLEPPHPQPHLPYTITFSSSVIIGNLRQQLIEDVMAGVGDGPNRIQRLIEAVDSFIQKLTS
ncbi:hypothetical protein Pcinc_018495 [Petrolisthes cinctipes]|uniref:Uncharacterized protein n=1 Tax=Petrolisthes cinctipes TaxID=88211 RepID=A0AAE1FP14_PETCI|nr:hypothetical protein Pcinc_018495 [Petrolisthes cinctipes]